MPLKLKPFLFHVASREGGVCVLHTIYRKFISHVSLGYVVHLIHIQCLSVKFTIRVLKSVFQLQRKHGSTSVKKETERVLKKKEMGGRDGERGKCKRGDWKPQVSLLIYQLCAWQPLGTKWMCTPQGSGSLLDNGDKEPELRAGRRERWIHTESMKGWAWGGVSSAEAIIRLTSVSGGFVHQVGSRSHVVCWQECGLAIHSQTGLV